MNEPFGSTTRSRARRSAMSASSASALIGISISIGQGRGTALSIIAAAERPSLAAEGAIFAGATGQFTLDRRDMSDAALPFVDQIANRPRQTLSALSHWSRPSSALRLRFGNRSSSSPTPMQSTLSSLTVNQATPRTAGHCAPPHLARRRASGRKVVVADPPDARSSSPAPVIARDFAGLVVKDHTHGAVVVDAIEFSFKALSSDHGGNLAAPPRRLRSRRDAGHAQ